MHVGESPRVRSVRDASPLLQRHYYEEADPDRALAMLEDEMSAAVPHHDGYRTDSTNRSTAGLGTLRTLLERECEAQVTPFFPCYPDLNLHLIPNLHLKTYNQTACVPRLAVCEWQYFARPQMLP